MEFDFVLFCKIFVLEWILLVGGCWFDVVIFDWGCNLVVFIVFWELLFIEIFFVCFGGMIFELFLFWRNCIICFMLSLFGLWLLMGVVFWGSWFIFSLYFFCFWVCLFVYFFFCICKLSLLGVGFRFCIIILVL